jgi:hypothetical protein
VRTVRTAVPGPSAFGDETTAEQEAWLRRSDEILKHLAKRRGLGQDILAGTIPLEPVLLWREQVITEQDVMRRLAKQATTMAFDALAGKVADDHAWYGFG